MKIKTQYEIDFVFHENTEIMSLDLKYNPVSDRGFCMWEELSFALALNMSGQ